MTASFVHNVERKFRKMCTSQIMKKVMMVIPFGFNFLIKKK